MEYVFNFIKIPLRKMSKPHDGVVTEASCNIVTQDAASISEVHLAIGNTPIRCHAFVDECLDHDHSSIIQTGANVTAELTWKLLNTNDWKDLCTPQASIQYGITANCAPVFNKSKGFI